MNRSIVITWYVISLPFVSAFALTGTLTLSLLIVLFLMLPAILISMSAGQAKLNLYAEDSLVLLFILTVVLSTFLNSVAYTGSKPLNHTAAYIATIALFYFVVRQYARDWASVTSVIRATFFIYILSCIYCIIDFVDKNFLAIGIEAFIYRPAKKEMDVLATNLLSRARGFAEEPGHFALYLEIFFPLALLYLKSIGASIIFVSLFIAISVLALLFTFSVASFIFVPAAMFLVFLIYLIEHPHAFQRKSFYASLIRGSILLAFLILIVESLGIFRFVDLLATIINKLSGSVSFNDRLSRLQEAYSLFIEGSLLNQILGFGPGAYITHQIDSVVSLYINLAFELGLLGLAIFLSFQVAVLVRILKIRSHIKYYVLFSFLVASMHYGIISNYWLPWYWFLLSIVYLIYSRENTRVFSFRPRRSSHGVLPTAAVSERPEG